MSASSLNSGFLLGIDTCGPAGSVALGRMDGGSLEVVEQVALEGRTYSATLVSAIQDLLSRHSLLLSKLGCMVVVSGPGSFTGVRVGLSAAKGIAEGAHVPLIAVSRLEVLAHSANCPNAALDAHRHEVFLRREGREFLAGPAELGAISAPEQIAVCDSAADLMAKVWPGAAFLRAAAPDAVGALQLGIRRILAGDFDDASLLDGHYLRRSDAEIFGPEPA